MFGKNSGTSGMVNDHLLRHGEVLVQGDAVQARHILVLLCSLLPVCQPRPRIAERCPAGSRGFQAPDEALPAIRRGATFATGARFGTATVPGRRMIRGWKAPATFRRSLRDRRPRHAAARPRCFAETMGDGTHSPIDAAPVSASLPAMSAAPLLLENSPRSGHGRPWLLFRG